MTCAWVDGSFREKKDGLEYDVASWAFVVVEDDEVAYEEFGIDVPEEFLESRNVAGEVFSVFKLLEFCVENEIDEIMINYDYEGLERWAIGEWKTNKALTKSYKKIVDDSGVKIVWNKIVSHTGDKWNEYVDQLAKNALEEILGEKKALVIDVEGEIEVDTNSKLQEKELLISDPMLVLKKASSFLEDNNKDEKKEVVLDSAEVLNNAKKLVEKQKYIDAITLLKPHVKIDTDEHILELYVSTLTKLGVFYSKKAISYCEKYLETKPKSKILKSYCYALYYGNVADLLINSNFTIEDYLSAKKSVLKILSITKNEKIVNEFIYPFVEVAFKIGDKGFLSELSKYVDLNIFSKEKINLGGKIYPSKYENVARFLKG